MARSILITPITGTALSIAAANLKIGSIKLSHDNRDVGGDGIPWVRQAAPYKCEAGIVFDSANLTPGKLADVANNTNKVCDATVVVTPMRGSAVTIYNASVMYSFTGEGVLEGSLTIVGNKVQSLVPAATNT